MHYSKVFIHKGHNKTLECSFLEAIFTNVTSEVFKITLWLGIEVHTCNTSTLKMKPEEGQGQGQPGRRREMLVLNSKIKENKYIKSKKLASILLKWGSN